MFGSAPQPPAFVPPPTPTLATPLNPAGQKPPKKPSQLTSLIGTPLVAGQAETGGGRSLVGGAAQPMGT